MPKYVVLDVCGELVNHKSAGPVEAENPVDAVLKNCGPQLQPHGRYHKYLDSELAFWVGFFIEPKPTGNVEQAAGTCIVVQVS